MTIIATVKDGMGRAVGEQGADGLNNAPEQGDSGKRAGKNGLLLRILSSLVLIPVALLLVYSGGWALAALGVAAGLVMLHEWNRMTEQTASGGLFLIQGASLAVVAALMVLDEPAGVLMVCGLGLVATILVSRLLGRSVAWAAAGLAYVVVPTLSLLWLRAYPEFGFGLCIWALVVIWATDIGGYFVGRRVGGPRLAPRISPNKTWSGLAGGVVLATVSALLLGIVFVLPAPAWLVVAAGAGLAVWAQVGDLAESAMKRHFGVKDSGSLIPGHGGVMDRLDGFVFVLPVVVAGVWLLKV